MTICASVKVRDGLVLATDSMSTVTVQSIGPDGSPRRLIQNYAHGRKLFQIGELPIGAMTFGAGNIGSLSIEGVVRNFKPAANRKSPRIVARALYRHIRALYDAQFGKSPTPPTLGMYVGGHAPGGAFAEEWEFLLPRDKEPRLVRPAEQFGMGWRGIEVPVTRLIKGYDPRMARQLAAAGLPQAVVNNILAQYESFIVYDAMPVQDAIDLAALIIKTTIGVSRFEVGPDSCGGPVQMAAVLPDSGFRWISRPHLGLPGGESP
jgi:hypothetical protein